MGVRREGGEYRENKNVNVNVNVNMMCMCYCPFITCDPPWLVSLLSCSRRCLAVVGVILHTSGSGAPLTTPKPSTHVPSEARCRHSVTPQPATTLRHDRRKKPRPRQTRQRRRNHASRA